MGPAPESLRPFEQAYLTGLLTLEHKSLLEMSNKGLLPHSHGHSATLLAAQATPHHSGLRRRLRQAPPGGVLAVDLLSVKHEGSEVQGTGRVYSSGDKSVVWGHSFLSSALVYKEQDPYPLQLAPFATEEMATQSYPKLTATEAMLTAVGDVHEAGYQIKAVSFDAQFRSKILLLTPHEGLRIFDLKFTTRFGLRSLKALPTPFVGRCRTDLWVTHGKEKVQVRALAERYPPGRSRYYKRFGYYAKRLGVWLEEVGYVDLIFVWKAKGTSWECFALLSTLKLGIQDVLQTWNLRSIWKSLTASISRTSA